MVEAPAKAPALPSSSPERRVASRSLPNQSVCFSISAGWAGQQPLAGWWPRWPPQSLPPGPSFLSSLPVIPRRCGLGPHLARPFRLEQPSRRAAELASSPNTRARPGGGLAWPAWGGAKQAKQQFLPSAEAHLSIALRDGERESRASPQGPHHPVRANCPPMPRGCHVGTASVRLTENRKIGSARYVTVL